MPILAEDIEKDLARRRLGYGRGPRQRFEKDVITLVGGVRHGRTLGSPVAIEIQNSEWFRSDKWHAEMSPEPGATQTPLTQPRPGHADLVGMQKYGFSDARDVLERASARETAARVAAGGLAKQLLRHIGVDIVSHVVQMGSAKAQNTSLPTFADLDAIDESEVLTPSDYENHIDKWNFTVPFVCGATNLGEALRRINEGAAMIRSKGEAGTGDVSNAMMHMRKIGGEIRRLSSLREDELYVAAKELQAPYALVKEVAETGKLPVVLFTAGGIATPADAALMMAMGADGVFIGSGIFKSGNPAQRAAACVKATTFWDDPKVVADASRGLGEAMVGINVADLPAPHRLSERGW
jgi:pyridoxal 5'-phosphate synthase subunit Pdx1